MVNNSEIQEIKRKSTSSVIFLTIRNFGIQGVSILGFFLLTLILGTADVGLFAIVAESVSILGYFSDVGLASALIQQKNEVTKEELRTTFLIQQILVLIALIVLSLIYQPIAIKKNYGDKEFWILISLCFSFAAASLKTIPSVLLERKLNFKMLSTVDIIENTSFYLVAVIFAIMGFGTYSYAFAAFFRSTLGLVVMYKISPWPIGFSYSKESLKKLFRFGIPFQINSFIAMAKDRLSSLLVAGIIGRESFGIISWAQKGPRLALSFMDSVMRVSFPTFSRLQNDPNMVKKSLDKSLFFVSFAVNPLLVGVAIVAPDFINLIPKYSKWLPAVLPLYFYAINTAIAAVTTPITNAFNAVGKIKTTTKFMIMWTVLTWVFYPLLSVRYGYLGTAVATLIVGLSSFIVWISANNVFGLNIFRSVSKPFLGALAMLVVLIPISNINLPPLLSIILKSAVGSFVYLFFHYLYSRTEMLWFYQQIKCLVNKK